MNYLELLNAIGCVTAEIAANGFGPPPVPPTPPTGLSALADAGAIGLGWDVTTGDYYNVYRSTVNGGPYTLLADHQPIGLALYSDNTVVAGTTYYYVVTRVVGGLESGYSNQASATALTPLQGLIASLLPFAPSVLLVADTIAGGDGAPVTAWADQSGNGNNGAITGASSLALAALNGRSAVHFSNAGLIIGAFPTTSGLLTDIVVYRGAVDTGTSDRIIAVGQAGIDDASSPVGMCVFRYAGAADQVGPYYSTLGQVGTILTTRGVFHIASVIFAAAGVYVAEDATSNPLFGGVSSLACNAYSCGGGMTGSQFKGDICFRMIFNADKTADKAAILALIEAYYGL